MTIFDIFVERVDNLEFTTAYSRLVARLISLVNRFGLKNGTSYIIDAPITHQDVANSINMTRETVSREFNVLESKGLAGHKNQKIVIYDLEKLKQELVSHFEKRLI